MSESLSLPQALDKIDLLEVKNKALSDQLDKVTADLFKLQDTAVELRNQLDEKKHSEQLAGWGIDRALEAHKLADDKPTPATITNTAQHMLDWIMSSSAKPVKG